MEDFMFQSISNKATRSAFFVSLFFSVIGQAQVCRVTTSGSSGFSGSSWQQPKDLTSALNNSASCSEIWVKSGTYYPTIGTDRNSSFFVKPGVKLYGGFYGTETSLTQRDYLYNKSTLSGNIGSTSTFIDNSYHVVYLDGSSGTGISQSTIIDGFIIRDGYANTGNGGGLYCNANGQNTACSPILRNLEFRDNIAQHGGAIYNKGFDGGDNRPLIENVRFINNNTLAGYEFGDGGAIFNEADDGISSPLLYNIEFSNNSAEDNGGAMYSLANNGGTSSPHISNSTFSGNSANTGGAFSIESINFSSSIPTVFNSTFYNNNSLDSGGAMYVRLATMEINNVTIAQNSATNSGGGLYTGFNTITIYNSILWGNQAASGAQLYNDNSQFNNEYNVIENGCTDFVNAGSGSFSCVNILSGNPQLGSLQNNRGFTETMLPGVGSSAIESGDNGLCEATDQRGISRPQNGQCDMGSVEVLSICRVTTNGSSVGNGADWASNAMALQTAIGTPNCHQIWIKTGTYKPTNGSDRNQTFSIKPGVTVLGGFAGNETNPNNRNIANNPVILSGDIGTTNDISDNSYHVVTLDGSLGTKILANTLIADLEIHSGSSSLGAFDFPNNSGAGIYCNGSGIGSACSPSLSNIKFVNNEALGGSGGGMFNNADNDGESSPQMVDVVFDNNSAASGGAMYNFGSNGGTSSAIVVNGQFINNSASNSGGAVYNNAIVGNNRSQFYLSQFTNNTANYGGAVYCSGQSFGINTTSFSKVTFASNQASFDGGAIYSAGWNEGMSKPTIQDVIFQSNLAQRGGAVLLNDLAGNGTAELNRVTFTQNFATDGGALYNDGENGFSHPRLTNVTFHSNFAINNGGAIYNNGDNGASSPNITNATFSGNSAVNGGAMYSSGSPSGVSSPIMRHLIMWDNSASGNGNDIYHNLAESNLFDSILEFGCPFDGVGNANCSNVMDTNPLLGPLANNGGYSQTLLPAAGSSAIDAGNDTFCPGEDQRGESRPNGSTCDIGSVEVDTQGPTDVIFKNGFD